MKCGDGTNCNVKSGGWGCCNDNGGRAKCPRNFPIMCAKKLCAGRKAFCCAIRISICNTSYGGPRPCKDDDEDDDDEDGEDDENKGVPHNF